MQPIRRMALLSVGAVCTAMVVGCAADYKWEFDPNRAIARARDDKKDLFLYFRNVFNPKCGDMERDVIMTPEVAKLFTKSVNGFIEFPWYQELAGNYGVTDVPSYVIIRPDGKRRVRTGFMPKEQFIAFAKSALSSGEAPATQKAPPPPPPKR
jgi:thioredoxin-related protein